MAIMLHVSLLLTLQVPTRHVRLCVSYMSVKREDASRLTSSLKSIS